MSQKATTEKLGKLSNKKNILIDLSNSESIKEYINSDFLELKYKGTPSVTVKVVNTDATIKYHNLSSSSDGLVINNNKIIDYVLFTPQEVGEGTVDILINSGKVARIEHDKLSISDLQKGKGNSEITTISQLGISKLYNSISLENNIEVSNETVKIENINSKYVEITAENASNVNIKIVFEDESSKYITSLQDGVEKINIQGDKVINYLLFIPVDTDSSVTASISVKSGTVFAENKNVKDSVFGEIYSFKFPFSAKDGIKEVTTNFSDGLLKIDGTVDTNQSTYETSDYVEKGNWNYMINSSITISRYFAQLCLYDSHYKLIQSINIHNQLLGKTIGLNIPSEVFYIKFSRKKDEQNSHLYYGNFDSIIDEMSNIKDIAKSGGSKSDIVLLQLGTSIPAGGKWMDNDNAYPNQAARMLGVTMYNECVGSSAVKAFPTTKSFIGIERNLCYTIEQKLDYFNDLWTVDDTEQTVTAGPRTKGVTEIPDITTYEEACYERYFFLSCSFEVKIIAKYFLSDQTEHDNFLQERLGDKYDVITAYARTQKSSFDFKANPDIIIIDHGHNDDQTQQFKVDEIDAGGTFCSAMNFLINTIYSYKPQAKIVMISDYDNFEDNLYTLQNQQAIADRWHLPILRVDKVLPFNNNLKYPTNGYWDKDGKWHNSGFTYSETENSYTSNCYFNKYIKGDGSLATIKQNANPRQINGVWHWDISPRHARLYDGLHPHSTKNLNVLTEYAFVEKEFLRKFLVKVVE